MRGTVIIWDKDEYLKRQHRRCGLSPDGVRRALLLALALLGAVAVLTYVCGPAPEHVAKIAQLPQLSQLSELLANLTQPPPPSPTPTPTLAATPRTAYNLTVQGRSQKGTTGCIVLDNNCCPDSGRLASPSSATWLGWCSCRDQYVVSQLAVA